MTTMDAYQEFLTPFDFYTVAELGKMAKIEAPDVGFIRQMEEIAEHHVHIKVDLRIIRRTLILYNNVRDDAFFADDQKNREWLDDCINFLGELGEYFELVKKRMEENANRLGV